VPSFDEMFPGLRGDEEGDTTTRKKHIGEEYYRDAMEARTVFPEPHLGKFGSESRAGICKRLKSPEINTNGIWEIQIRIKSPNL
jgi:hypothetical protein